MICLWLPRVAAAVTPVVNGETAAEVMRCSRARLQYPALLVFCILVAVLVAGGRAEAINPVISKLHGRPPVSHAGDEFGAATAINETWIVIGAPLDDELGENAGAVFVHSALTGQFVRKLRAPDAVPFGKFGTAVAIHGSQVLVGATGQNASMGKAYLFNLGTGVLVRSFTGSSTFALDEFGGAVALNGKFAAIGAPSEADGGAAYLFDLATGAPTGRMSSPSFFRDAFGYSIALSGDLVIIGDPTSDTSNGPDIGGVYVFNALTREYLWSATGTTNSGRFGESLAADGGRVLVGARRRVNAAVLYDLATGFSVQTFTYAGAEPTIGNSVALQGNLVMIGATLDASGSASPGAAFFFDARTGESLYLIVPPDGDTSDRFGYKVALSGSLALCSAFDDDLGADAGAVYFVRPVSGPMPLTTMAKIGDFAPGAPQTEFNTFKAAHLNGQGELLLLAGLRGPGSNGSTDTGVWSRFLAMVPSLDLALKSRRDLSGYDGAYGLPYRGVRVASLSSITFHLDDVALVQGTLAGTGVTTANNRALFGVIGSTLTIPLRTDRAITTSASGPSWNGARVGSMLRVAQAVVNENLVVSCTLRPGLAGTSATSDTGILVLDHDGNVQNTFYREGQPTPEDDTFGQFMGTTAAGPTLWFAYRAFTLPGAKQAVFYGSYGGRGERLGLQDAPLDGELAGTRFTSFAGESLQEGTTYWRATLAGTGVTTLNNQVLMREGEGVVVRTGHEIEPGLFVSRIEKYWALNAGYVVMQVILRGTGVTAANNRALYLRWVEGGADVYMRLLRTGVSADGCGAARIAALQQVVAEPTGRYAILASLAGAPLNANQALFMGNARAGDNTVARRVLRQPFMRLRKGTSYQAVHGQSARILSISITNTTDTDGVGNKGMGQVINPTGQIVLNILFNDSAREIMIGAP